VISVNAQQTQPSEVDTEVDMCETNTAGEYCSIDREAKRIEKRSVGEMELEFLLALSSYYYDGKPTMSDEEFELLKEELLWNGSKVPILDKNEQRFLEASIAYSQGQPIMSDTEYDKLKNQLRLSSSVVTAQGPRCSIRTRKMYSDAAPDYLKMTLLNVPATLLVLGFIFSLDDLTGFEITKLIELPPPYGTGLLWGLLLPAIFVLATSLTNIAFREGLIMRGECPSCGTENFTYFGDILTVSGNKGTNSMDCDNCGARLTFDSQKRLLVVDATAEDRKAQIEADKAARLKARGVVPK